MSLAKGLLLTILLTAAVWFAKSHFENAATLTYSVSDPIEITVAPGRAEYAQEIAVLNQGHVAAESISIKVPHAVSSYQLRKHSNLAKEASIPAANSFELIYPKLPAEQRIVLLVRYDGSPLAKEWISVAHSAGNAQLQEKQVNPISPLTLLGIFWGGFLIAYLLDFRRKRCDSYIRAADEEELFSDTRPWFASPGEWSKIQCDAIERALQRSRAPSLEKNLAYRLLSRQQPEHMRDEHWETLKNLATEILEAEFSRAISRCSNKNKLKDLTKLKKPDDLPWPVWERFQDAIFEQLYLLFLPVHQSEIDYENLLVPSRALLRDIPDAMASELRDAAQTQYFRHLLEQANDTWGDPRVVLQNARIDLLTADQASRLGLHVEQLCRMRKMPRSWEVSELKVFAAGGRPDWMPKAEFMAITNLIERFETLAQERELVRRRERKASAELAEADKLKKHVLAQLGIIDRVLMQPEAIDKLEDHDRTFAPGNRKSLECVASLLKLHRAGAESGSLAGAIHERQIRNIGQV